MSRHVLFSFLGLGDYLPCYYTFEGEKASFSRFTQTAIYELMSKDNQMEVVLFLTKDAKKKNWFNSEGRDGNFQEGLASTFQRIAPDAKVKLVEISKEQDEQGNWMLFDAILKEVQEDDTVYFDITHSFRSIPLLALIVLTYARLVKNAKIGKLVYGWFESLGPQIEVKKMPDEKRVAPIVDMTNMVTLLDWTNGVNQFKHTGDASFIKQLTSAQMGSIMKGKTNQAEKKKAIIFNKLAIQLEIVGKCMQTSRSLRIMDEIKKLQSLLSEAKQFESGAIKPLIPLLNEIEEKYKGFTNDVCSHNYVQMANWCYDNGWIQPAYTLLQENAITLICEVYNIDAKDENKRLDISSAIRIMLKGIEEEDWIVRDKEFTKQIIDKLKPYRKMLSPFNNITDYRNDLNHAGTKENRHPERFEQNFQNKFKEISSFFQAIGSEKREKIARGSED
ncbi:TIGR02221 family CRISPR-associated protein [Bacillus sp. FJAT-47783]|uniref:TIGR02221 family CRISPR-associated protein n=1 Tax=Bacillus sp. FJAT-47783 TaxID=2922712 RepID=UPI001FAB569A|nr:TIGR02221 family CRISPR-associated protein [Bacillus sp. FJAT-47783]